MKRDRREKEPSSTLFSMSGVNDLLIAILTAEEACKNKGESYEKLVYGRQPSRRL